MTRSLDWSPLGLSSDPVPGEPDEVRQAAIRLRNTATAIQDAYDSIKQASDECGGLSDESEAVDTFMDQADDVADKLIKALPRYEAAAEALESYDDDLAEAQLLSATALTMAENAKSTMDAEQAGDEPPGLFEETPGSKAMDDAHTKLQEAITLRDTSANSAKNKIHNVIDDDDVKDSFWDNMGDFADLMSTISAVLGALALVVNFIPVIGQALAAVLGVLALVTGAIALILHLGAAIENGEGWDKVIFDAIGVLTFGVGAAFSGGARSLSLAVKSLGWSKLKGISGISSRLTGSFFKTKGPMVLSEARAVRAGSASFMNGFRGAFTGLSGDLSAAFSAIRSTGFNGIMAGISMVPGRIAGGIPNSLAGLRAGIPDLANLLNGVPDLAGLVRGANTIGDFADVANVARLAEMANTARLFSLGSHITFGAGSIATILDNVLHVDIPYVP